MAEDELYIERLKEKLDTIEDKELLSLVKRLLIERNRLQEIANIDPLTGLNNRRMLSRIREFSGIMMIDIDDFKSINDTYGHDIGDYVIQQIGRILKSSTRAQDQVCRLGGDEFLIVFVDCPEEVMANRAEQIKFNINKYVTIPESNRTVTTSIGYSYNYTHANLAQVMKGADVALYKSKTDGKNQINRFEQFLPTIDEGPKLI